MSFNIPTGGTLALVGESGSGKSVCSQAIMGLLPRTATVSSGSILFEDPRADGGVDVPPALQPYMGGLKVLMP